MNQHFQQFYKCEVLNTFIISDHKTIVINGVKKMITEKESLQEILSWKNYTQLELQTKLRKFNWNLINQYCLEDKTNMFNSLLVEALKSLVVKKTIKTKNINKWYSEELNDLRIQKDNSYEAFNFIKSVSDFKNISESEMNNKLWTIFVQKRNIYSRKVKHAHNEFIKNEIEMYKKDPKKLWCILKDLLII